MTKPRIVPCAGCGEEQRLKADVPGVYAELPSGWRRIGMSKDSSSIIYCAGCYRDEMSKALRPARAPSEN